MRTILSRLPNGRYRIHYGSAMVEADIHMIAELLVEQIQEMMAECPDDCFSFEFTGKLPRAELANVVYELDCVAKAKRQLQYAHENKLSKLQLQEAFNRWVDAAYTQRLEPLYRALGFDTDARDAA